MFVCLVTSVVAFYLVFFFFYFSFLGFEFVVLYCLVIVHIFGSCFASGMSSRSL